MAMQTQSAEKQAAMQAAAHVTGAGIQSFGQTQSWSNASASHDQSS